MRILIVTFLLLSLVMITACGEDTEVVRTATVYIPTPGYPDGQFCVDLSKCEVKELQVGHFQIKCKE